MPRTTVGNAGALLFKEHPKLLTNITQNRCSSLLSTQTWFARNRVKEKTSIGYVIIVFQIQIQILNSIFNVRYF